MQEIHGQITVETSIAPIDATATTVGAIHDLQGYEQCEFVMCAGVTTGGTWTPLVEHGDASDLADAAAVADADLLPSGTGQEAAHLFAADDDGESRKLGYRGNKRYVRLTMTETGTISVGLICAMALKFKAARTATGEGQVA